MTSMLIQLKSFFSLAPNNVTINQSCLSPTTNTMEDVDIVGISNNVEEDIDNERESNSIEEDERIIDEHETYTMPSARVINWGHLLQNVLLIHVQGDLYMIQLLGKQKYINIISNALIGWVGRVCSSFDLCSSLLHYHYLCVGLLLFTDLCVDILYFLFSFICFYNFLIP